MKKLFFLLLGFYKTWATDPDNECQDHNNEGYWICLNNTDNTYNVTYDCSRNNNKTLELKLWSSKFPKTMKVLKIQNCDQLTLDSNCTTNEEPIITFSHLNVLNISEFSLIGRQNETPIEYTSNTFDRKHENEFLRIFYRPKNSSTRRLFSTVRLPENVIFENIKMAKMNFPLMSNSGLMRCGVSSDKFILGSFKLINVTMDELETYFLWEYPEDSYYMKEFVLENVKIGNVRKRAIYLHNSKAKIEISNSNFSKISGNMADLDASKVLITKNSFGELPTFAFKVFAEKFTFSKNEVAALKRLSLKIESLKTEITNNIFHHIQDHALRGLIPPKYPLMIYSRYPERLLNISNNIIHVLSSSSLSIHSDEADESQFFDIIIVKNNLITCSCQNLYWFNDVRFDTIYTFKRFFHYYWLNKDNQNRCLNIPNCGLNQAYDNYHELCSGNYKCPNVSKSFRRVMEGDVVPLKNEKSSIDQNVTAILENLKYLLKNKNYLNISKYDSEYGSYLQIVFYCVLIVTFLCCLSLGYYVLAKCFKFKFFQAQEN